MGLRTAARSLRRLAAVALVFAVACTLLAGCSAPADPVTDCLAGTTRPAPALVLAVAVHQGAPRPALPEPTLPLLEATLAAGHPVRVVAIDGTPELVPLATTRVARKTCDGMRAGVAKALAGVSAAVTAASADADGNDLYAAIDLAAATARSLAAGSTVIVVDSGLADRGPLDYTRPGMTMADPAEAAAFAARTRPLDVSGLAFLLLLGYTAPPQQPLSGTERDNVAGTWAATLTQLGAGDVSVVSAPRPTRGPDTDRTTRPAPVAGTDPFVPPRDDQPTIAVFHEEQVSFEPDRTDLVDPAAARTALADVIGWLAGDDLRRITVTGTTSSAGDANGRQRLSTARAETIKALIVAGHPAIDPDRIRTRGVGVDFPSYVDDRRSDGSLDPVLAAANRTVQITAYAH